MRRVWDEEIAVGRGGSGDREHFIGASNSQRGSAGSVSSAFGISSDGAGDGVGVKVIQPHGLRSGRRGVQHPRAAVRASFVGWRFVEDLSMDRPGAVRHSAFIHAVRDRMHAERAHQESGCCETLEAEGDVCGSDAEVDVVDTAQGAGG